MDSSHDMRGLQYALPPGAELYFFDPHGLVRVVSNDGLVQLDPVGNAGDRGSFLRFIDERQFTRYFIGNASTSDRYPSNATSKLEIMRSQSAFTPHAHGAEHFVLCLGYASCALYDKATSRIADVRLFPGTLLHIPAMMPHSFNNRSAYPLCIVVSNTGMGIDDEDYAITASQAESRSRDGQRRGDKCLAGELTRLAAALRLIEREMPAQAVHQHLTWRERIAAGLRQWLWRLESA